jgi:hypothetical protein
MARILGYESPDDLIGSVTDIDEQVFGKQGWPFEQSSSLQ